MNFLKYVKIKLVLLANKQAFLIKLFCYLQVKLGFRRTFFTFKNNFFENLVFITFLNPTLIFTLIKLKICVFLHYTFKLKLLISQGFYLFAARLKFCIGVKIKNKKIKITHPNVLVFQFFLFFYLNVKVVYNEKKILVKEVLLLSNQLN